MMEPYKLTIKDKIILYFKNSYSDCFIYLYPKVKEHYDKWFEKNEIRKVYDYNTFVSVSVKQILYKYKYTIDI